jgi:hypothetical protein
MQTKQTLAMMGGIQKIHLLAGITQIAYSKHETQTIGIRPPNPLNSTLKQIYTR